MALRPDPLEPRRLIGDNTSEVVTLSIADTTNFPLAIRMLAGDDTVNGSTANDWIFGNQGEDLIIADLGGDILLGGKGKDFLNGGEGNDVLIGGQDADLVVGGAGNDIISGDKGNDLLYSGNGNDTLVGGLGHDILIGLDENKSIKFGGINFYVLQAEPGVTDINNADFIGLFRPGIDRIGLAGGLTASDVDLQYVTNTTILAGFDGPEKFKQFIPPGSFDFLPVQSQGTLIKVKNSGDIVGYVTNVTVAELQGSIVSAQGF